MELLVCSCICLPLPSPDPHTAQAETNCVRMAVYYRQSAMCGFMTGGFAQFLASPADLVKVNIQMEGKRKLEGLAPRSVPDISP